MAADSTLGVGEGLRELNPTAVAPTLSLLLRSETAGHHRRAEGADFQRLLFAGRIPLAGYRNWLEQLLLVHRALETRLWRAWESKAWRELTAADRRRSVQLEADLIVLQTAVLSEPAPSTEAFLGQIAAWPDEPPAELLGALYVLEGSSNGARMMAPGIRTAYGFTGVSGTQNLDPYGEAQSARWQAFRAALDEALPESAWPAALEGARVCFEAITKIGEDLRQNA